jgi:hypothetical protein
MSARAAAAVTAVVVVGCGPSHPSWAFAAAGTGLIGLAGFLAAWRRTFRPARCQAVPPRIDVVPSGRIPCRIHRDGHLYGCPVTEWQPPGRSWS